MAARILPVYIEEAHFSPASVDPAQDVPDGWELWPCFIKARAPQPSWLTNALGAPVTYQVTVETTPAFGANQYRLEAEGYEFGPRWYLLFDPMNHDGTPGTWAIDFDWLQNYSPNIRLLRKVAP